MHLCKWLFLPDPRPDLTEEIQKAYSLTQTVGNQIQQEAVDDADPGVIGW